MMSMDGLSRAWGPVFDAERVTQARRWQNYAVRSLFVLGLLLGLCLGVSAALRDGKLTVQEMARVGSSAYALLTFLELVAVLVVAPAATAGAICLDKSRGMLAHLFVTDLSNREIILGKLAARLLPVWGLLACAVPVAAMATLLGGIDPMALTGAFIIAVGLAILGCSLALMLSVWASKPHEVLTVVFGVWTLWLLAAPVWQLIHGFPLRSALWLERTQPFYLAGAPYDHPGETSLVEPVLFSLGCGLIGAIFMAIAIAKVRVVGCRSDQVQARRVGWVRRRIAWCRGQVRWGKGPELDANPVLWREWHRSQPSRWSKVVWFGFESLCALWWTGMLILWWIDFPLMDDGELPGLILGFQAVLGLLLVGTSTASVLAEERARGSLDVLISTPVSTRSILAAKWRGAFRRIPLLAFWPVVVGMAYSIGLKLDTTQIAVISMIPVCLVAQGAALVSVGLALATWIKRTGQATTWTITALLVSVVGWPIVGESLPLVREITPQNRFDVLTILKQYILDMGSPFFNVACPLVLTEEYQAVSEAQGLLILLIGWTAFYGLMTWGLFELTVLTFDRCLGRIPERPSTPRLAPNEDRSRGIGRLKGWGWKIPGGGGRRVGRAASFGPPPR